MTKKELPLADHPCKGRRTKRGEPLAWLMSHVGYKGDDCLRWPYGYKGGGYGCVNHDERAHRRMCIEAHGEPPFDGAEAAHICGNGHLGCVNPNHLKWATKIENQRDRVIHGTHNRGARSHMVILNEDQVREIRELFGKETQVSIARRFGVDRSTVRAIHSKRSWAWLV